LGSGLADGANGADDYSPEASVVAQLHHVDVVRMKARHFADHLLKLKSCLALGWHRQRSRYLRTVMVLRRQGPGLRWVHVLKKTNQTTPRNVAAGTTLTIRTKKMLGPGSACRASVAVSTMRPFFAFQPCPGPS
jgi:hypothetical protein